MSALYLFAPARKAILNSVLQIGKTPNKDRRNRLDLSLNVVPVIMLNYFHFHKLCFTT